VPRQVSLNLNNLG
jgi:hypothetical protein